MDITRVSFHTNSFNGIIHIIKDDDEKDMEIWFARELQSLLGYARWENFQEAINRAMELVEMLNAGTVVEGKIDVYPTKQQIDKIKIEPDKINNLLGTDIPKKDMIKNFKKLENTKLEIGPGGIICFYDTLLKLDEKNYIVPISSVIC